MHKMLFFWSRQPVSSVARVRAGPWFAWFATAVLLWRCRKRIARVIYRMSLPLQMLQRRPGYKSSTTTGPAANLPTTTTTTVANNTSTGNVAASKTTKPVLQSWQDLTQQQKRQHNKRPKLRIPVTVPPHLDIVPAAAGDHQRNGCHDQLPPPRRLTSQQAKAMKHSQDKLSELESHLNSLKEECEKIGQLTPEQQQQLRVKQSMEMLRREAQNILTRSRLKRLHTGPGAHILGTTSRKLDGLQISQQFFYKVTRSGRIYGRYGSMAGAASTFNR